jgi:hypothetical protein
MLFGHTLDQHVFYTLQIQKGESVQGERGRYYLKNKNYTQIV